MNNVSPEVRAVLVEDDYLTGDFWQEELGKSDIKVERLSQEYAFRQRLPYWRDHKPDIFVLGTWVKWTYPAPDMPEPTEDVIKEGYRRAGERMQGYIAADPILQHTPVIIWGLESDDKRLQGKNGCRLPSGALFVSKYTEEDNHFALTIRSLAMAAR